MVNENDHPGDEEIAAFLDGGLSAADRASVARHVADCDECRALLASQKGYAPLRLTTPGRDRRTRMRWTGITSIAAAAVLVVSVALQSRSGSGVVDELRGDTARTIEAPILIAQSPADGARVSVDTLVLRWGSAGADATYELTIVDAAGDEIWSAHVTTTDVSIPLEARARLKPEATYYWRAEALLPDLRTASTGSRGFVPVGR